MDTASTPAARQDGVHAQSLLSTISNEMVGIYKDQFGRGPTKTRTNWAGPDVLVTTLESTLTAAEHTLLALGHQARLRELRMLFQYAEIERFCAPVQRLTGRHVRAFLSGIDVDADVATEMFVLHPRGYDGPLRVPHTSG